MKCAISGSIKYPGRANVFGFFDETRERGIELRSSSLTAENQNEKNKSYQHIIQQDDSMK